MLGFMSVNRVRAILGSIKVVHLMREGQVKYAGN